MLMRCAETRSQSGLEAEAMNRRGIEYNLVQVEPDLWRWQFRVGNIVTTGWTETKLKRMAARRVRQRIDRELNNPRDLNHRQPNSAGSRDAA
jgi:hypothetical protein